LYNGKNKDHYKTLNIQRTAGVKEIKVAYRHLARKYHPDRNSNVSDDIMKNINIAFEILSDKEKREQYDKTLFDNSAKDNDTVTKNFKYKSNFNDKNNHHSEYDSNEHFSSNSTIFESNANNKDNQTSEYTLNFEFKEKETATDIIIPKGQYQIIVEPSLCLAFGSCETLAPKVFVVEKNKRINPKAIVKSENGADFETILDAAKTCPTKAIIITDRFSGERIFP
jgi:molecular chaperone DnaJ